MAAKTRAETFMDELTKLTGKMPRGPQHETQLLRLIAQHTDSAGDVMIFLTSMSDGSHVK